MKRCSRCKLEKPVGEFYADKDSRSGLRSRCKECDKAGAAEWYRKNPPDPQRKREILRRFRERNPGRDAEYGRKWRNKDPERARELARARGDKWRRTKPERKIASEMRRRARLRAAAPIDTDYIAVLRGDPCSYCGTHGAVVDHIEPLHGGGNSSWENLTGACITCNASKGTKRLLPFLLRAAQRS